jgi:hypothetical protein
MPPKHQGKGKSGPKSGRKDGENQMVPFNVLTNLTDRMRFPSLQERVFVCVQSLEIVSWLASTASTINANFYIATLANVCGTNLSSFTAIFDQYRIDCIELWLTPNQNAVASAATYATSPNLATVLDYDDSSLLGSMSQATAYASCIHTEVFEKQRRCFKPRIAYAAYGAGAFSSYANERAGWIDCSSSNVVHYGMKALCDADGNTSGPHASWDLFAKAQVSFRATH